MNPLINQNDISYGTPSKIREAINKSISNNSIETFRVLQDFVQAVIHLSISKKSLEHFKEYIFFPTFYYDISYKLQLQDKSLSELYKYCSETAASQLKQIIWIYLGFESKKSKDLSSREFINKFYYWAFTSFSRLFYFIISNRDKQQFNFALNEYDQIVDSMYPRNYEIETKLRNLQSNNPDYKEVKEIGNLKLEYNIANQFEIYRRHVLLGIKYWIFFLYKVGKLNKDETLSIINLIKIRYVNSKDIISDLLFLRSNNYSFYLDWNNWDFIERRSGKVYSPPNPIDWLTFGFLVDQISENDLFINIENFDPKELSQVIFLHSDLIQLSKYFEDNYEKWKDILKISSKDALKDKTNQILTQIARLKRKNIGYNEKVIAKTPLSTNEIEKFKNIVGQAWKSQASVRNLFRTYGTIDSVSYDDLKLKQIGQRIFIENAKRMFIEGEYHQDIYGIDRIGSEIGRWEDNEFLNTVIKSDYNKVIGTSVQEILDKALNELKKIKPNLIILGYDYNHLDRELLESKSFTPNWLQSKENDEISNFYLGTYDEIPIYLSYSDFLKNRILVCDFEASFKLKYKTNPNWYENELNIDINEVSDEEAERILKKEPYKWKQTEDRIKLNDEDALTLIKNSIVIDIWSTKEFQIINKETFVIGQINDKNALNTL